MAMNEPLLLVVEDDGAVRNLITVTLQLQKYDFLCAEDGKQALLAAASRKPDILLLDLGLPDMDGVEVIRRIRSWSNMPILVISARSDDRDKIAALDAGADDYITKPFSVDELLARIRTTLRRLSVLTPQAAESTEFTNGGLHIDYAAHWASVDGQELHLTPLEYKLLCLLARNVGKVLTHQYILREVWGSTLPGDVASLRVFMVALRKKLEAGGTGSRYIQTHVGIGYRLVKYESEAQENPDA